MFTAKLKRDERRGRPNRGPRGGALLFAVAVALFPRLAGAAPSPNGSAPDGLNYPGVHLGMTLEAWKALPRPKTLPVAATPICETKTTATATIVCGYFSHYGRFTLPEEIALGPKLRARRLRFTFVDGRLSSIAFQTSINVFNDLIARLNARYGRANTISRDSVSTPLGDFPRVREDWKTPSGEIELVDPVRPFTDLSVRLSVTGNPSARAS
jgi:hypothetical protein